MSRGLITVIIFGIIVLFGGVWACNKRNSFVGLRENAKAQWQQVESQYQRRADLIPNIVATVKGEANFERSTLEAVVNARAKATQVTINPDNLDDKSIERYKQVQVYAFLRIADHVQQNLEKIFPAVHQRYFFGLNVISHSCARLR